MSTPSQQLSRTDRRATAARASSGSPAASPWATQLYVVYGVLVAIGLILLVIGNAIVSDKTLYDDQVPGINLSIVGTVITAAAGISLLVVGRRAVTARRVYS